VRISLFSQSLFALPLEQAIRATAKANYGAIELACIAPHLDMETARDHAPQVVRWIEEAGLRVSALSGFNCFTDPDSLARQLDDAETILRLAPEFHTQVVKLTPGQPDSARAEYGHWQCLQRALDRLVPLAQSLGLKLAFETHMRQLTDTLASTRRFLSMVPTDVVGLTVDYSNMAFARENMAETVQALLPHTYNTHLKNGIVDAEGGWHFQALDQGWTDYVLVLGLLRDAAYDGYLTLECLSPEARQKPLETVQRDLRILQGYLRQVGWNPE
jgi:sugar phosphate isomerase/epimerase